MLLAPSSYTGSLWPPTNPGGFSLTHERREDGPHLLSGTNHWTGAPRLLEGLLDALEGKPVPCGVRGSNGEGTLTERSSQRRDARRVTVGEAAALLGISKEAVRMRIRRGTLRSEKSDDRVYVWLDEDLGANQDDVQHADQGAAYRELIEQLRAEVEAWREEARRKDHIIAGLIERLPPQLEAPPDEPGADLTATEEPGKVRDQHTGAYRPPLVAEDVGRIGGKGWLRD